MEGLPGIHQRFIPKKHFVCSRESTKRFLHFFPGNCAEKTAYFKLSHLPSLQWKLDAILKPPDWLPRLGEKSENLVKTWWKPGEFPKPAHSLKKTLVNFQYLVNSQNLVKTWWIHQVFTKTNKEAFYTSKINQKKRVFFFLVKLMRFMVKWWKSKTWWKLDENLVNFQILVNTWLFPKPGENLVNMQNLVKTWWMPKPGENLLKT
jgi:hypothetical protein